MCGFKKPYHNVKTRYQGMDFIQFIDSLMVRANPVIVNKVRCRRIHFQLLKPDQKRIQ